MEQAIKYVQEELGIKIEISPVEDKRINSLPVYLANLYSLYTGRINECAVLFAHFIPETIIAPSNYTKHEKILKQVWQMPIIFVLDQVQSYNRRRLSSLGINLIVPGVLIYLPELFIVLSKDNKHNNSTTVKSLSPTAQTVLLYYLYGKENDFSYAQIQNTLKMPYQTVCRAMEMLVRLNLCQTIGSRNKCVHFESNKRELLDQALPLLKSPVNKVIYTEKVPGNAYKTGLSALTEYSMINPDEYEHVAISNETLKELGAFSQEDKYLPIHIEVWNYNPALFANDGVVDKISLYLSMKDRQDERIKYELNQMIQQLW